MVGIAGQGMTALAGLLLAHGHVVSGCDDQVLLPDLDNLHRQALDLGVKVERPNCAAHVQFFEGDVVGSSFLRTGHHEMMAAANRGLAVYSRQEALGRLLHERRQSAIACAGVAGKSTTTAMVAFLLEQLDLDPLVYLGAVDPNRYGANFRWGAGPAVIEACEFDRAFHHFPRPISIVNNMFWGEHPDIYKDQGAMLDAFETFAAESAWALVSSDDSASRSLANRLDHGRVETFGTHSSATYRLTPTHARERRHRVDPNVPTYTVVTRDGDRDVVLSLPRMLGEHNHKNALGAVLAVRHLTGIDIDLLLDRLAEFRPLGRRLEVVGVVGQLTIVDDYGHHPEHFAVAFDALRSRFPDHILTCVAELSVLRRTALLLDDYARRLSKFDNVMLLDVVPGSQETEEDSTGLVQRLLGVLPKGRHACESEVLDHCLSGRAQPEVVMLAGARRSGSRAARVYKELRRLCG